MAKRIQRKANNGFLLFVDRWPTNQYNCMDGPRLNYKFKSNFIFEILSKFEYHIYDNFIRANIVLFFKVTLKNALKRNLEKKKINKETQAQIKNRFYQNTNVKPLANKILYFDNNTDYKTNLNNILVIIWKEISSTSFME